MREIPAISSICLAASDIYGLQALLALEPFHVESDMNLATDCPIALQSHLVLKALIRSDISVRHLQDKYASERYSSASPIAPEFVLPPHNNHPVGGIANGSEDDRKEFNQPTGEDQSSNGSAAPH